ncbi:hypothetical protein EC968_007406 [Mortierella alpina]|nr:hypothetical protein EC968_007406 [Mortierella alpina]
MTNKTTLFCLVEGETLSRAFSIKIQPDDTVDDLKELIKAKQAPAFDDITSNSLTLWKVSVPIAVDKHKMILLDSLELKDELDPRDDISAAFSAEPPKKSDLVLVQRPSPPSSDPEIAALRKQLSDVFDSSFSIGIVVKPEKKVAFSWCGIVDTATLDDLKKNIFDLYPQYAHDDYLEIFVYNGQPKPELIRDNEDLRKILKVAKTTSKARLTISLETPSKNFSAWTFKDVCDEYNLSGLSDPGVEVLPPFTDIQSSSLNSAVQDRLISEVESRVDVLPLFGANEATKSMVVASFLVVATTLFKEDLYLTSQRNLSGRRGNGPVDFSVYSRKTHAYTLGVTEVKKDDFRQGVAQNIVQLESALTEKKRKRETFDIDGEEEPPRKQRAYGIVTDSAEWAFLECTLHEDETVSYRMSKLDEVLNFRGKWQEDAKVVLGKIVWLWSRMVEEIPARDAYSRKASSSPSNKRINL